MTEQTKSTLKRYRPSNSCEGNIFFDNWCSKCSKDKLFNGSMTLEEATPKDLCRIIGDSMAYHIDEEGYPDEWQYGEDGWPTCTAFDAVEKS